MKKSLKIVRLGLLAGLASTAWAAPLNYLLQPTPDISVSFINVTYNAGTGAFSAYGAATLFFHDDPTQVPYQINDGTFSITATINSSGQASGGQLLIGGAITELPAGSSSQGSLLTGTLSQFGFAEIPDGALEFLFNTDGGDLLPLYPDARIVMTQIGVPDGFGAGFSGNFLQSFTNSGFGALADTGIVPEPGSLSLLLSAAGLLLFLLRRSRATQAS